MIQESSREALTLLGFDTDLAWRGEIVRARFDGLKVSLARGPGGFSLVANGYSDRTMIEPYSQFLLDGFDQVELSDIVYKLYCDLYHDQKEPPQELAPAKRRYAERLRR